MNPVVSTELVTISFWHLVGIYSMAMVLLGILLGQGKAQVVKLLEQESNKQQ